MAVVDAGSRVAYVRIVPNMIETAILAEYRKRKLKPYGLWKLVEQSGVSRATVYAFVNGRTHLSSEHAATFMNALGLKICHTDKRPEN